MRKTVTQRNSQQFGASKPRLQSSVIPPIQLVELPSLKKESTASGPGWIISRDTHVQSINNPTASLTGNQSFHADDKGGGDDRYGDGSGGTGGNGGKGSSPMAWGRSKVADKPGNLLSDFPTAAEAFQQSTGAKGMQSQPSKVSVDSQRSDMVFEMDILRGDHETWVDDEDEMDFSEVPHFEDGIGDLPPESQAQIETTPESAVPENHIPSGEAERKEKEERDHRREQRSPENPWRRTTMATSSRDDNLDGPARGYGIDRRLVPNLDEQGDGDEAYKRLWPKASEKVPIKETFGPSWRAAPRAFESSNDVEHSNARKYRNADGYGHDSHSTSRSYEPAPYDHEPHWRRNFDNRHSEHEQSSWRGRPKSSERHEVDTTSGSWRGSGRTFDSGSGAAPLHDGQHGAQKPWRRSLTPDAVREDKTDVASWRPAVPPPSKSIERERGHDDHESSHPFAARSGPRGSDAGPVSLLKRADSHPHPPSAISGAQSQPTHSHPPLPQSHAQPSARSGEFIKDDANAGGPLRFDSRSSEGLAGDRASRADSAMVWRRFSTDEAAVEAPPSKIISILQHGPKDEAAEEAAGQKSDDVGGRQRGSSFSRERDQEKAPYFKERERPPERLERIPSYSKERPREPSFSRDGQRPRAPSFSKDGERPRAPSFSKDGERHRAPSFSKDGERQRAPSFSKDGEGASSLSDHDRAPRPYGVSNDYHHRANYHGDRGRGSDYRGGHAGERGPFYGERDRGAYGEERERSGYAGEQHRGLPYSGERERGGYLNQERGYYEDRGDRERHWERGGGPSHYHGERHHPSGEHRGGFYGDRERERGGRERGYSNEYRGPYERDQERGSFYDRERRGYSGDRDRERDGERERGYGHDESKRIPSHSNRAPPYGDRDRRDYPNEHSRGSYYGEPRERGGYLSDHHHGSGHPTDRDRRASIGDHGSYGGSRGRPGYVPREVVEEAKHIMQKPRKLQEEPIGSISTDETFPLKPATLIQENDVSESKSEVHQEPEQESHPVSKLDQPTLPHHHETTSRPALPSSIQETRKHHSSHPEPTMRRAHSFNDEAAGSKPTTAFAYHDGQPRYTHAGRRISPEEAALHKDPSQKLSIKDFDNVMKNIKLIITTNANTSSALADESVKSKDVTVVKSAVEEPALAPSVETAATSEVVEVRKSEPSPLLNAEDSNALPNAVPTAPVVSNTTPVPGESGNSSSGIIGKLSRRIASKSDMIDNWRTRKPQAIQGEGDQSGVVEAAVEPATSTLVVEQGDVKAALPNSQPSVNEYGGLKVDGRGRRGSNAKRVAANHEQGNVSLEQGRADPAQVNLAYVFPFPPVMWGFSVKSDCS
ncbi:hypothetical protein HDU76_011886 [Blyttiomyces sp. JEL0837]|nr:hypothetical protein HDU76_011886 [Blyttiomyces sp. JEL0837]